MYIYYICNRPNRSMDGNASPLRLIRLKKQDSIQYGQQGTERGLHARNVHLTHDTSLMKTTRLKAVFSCCEDVAKDQNTRDHYA